MSSTPTHCPYCALQCGMHLADGSTGIEVEARQFPTNRGGLCRKGWTAAELLHHPSRLTSPLLRRSREEPFHEVSWDDAIEFAREQICAVQQIHGREAVGVFGGGGLTNESAYLLGKFARVALRTPNIDYNGRFCMSSGASAGLKAYGLDRGLPFPVEDIARTEVILLTGGNPAETMPPLMQYFDSQTQNGGKLIVVDPRRTPSAAGATLHLQLTPGTDMALAHGMLHIAIRDGLINKQFILNRTTGFDSIRPLIASYWPERVERITGVSVAQMTEAVHYLAKASSAMILSSRGTEQQSSGVDNALAFINLALALGQAGKPNSGWGCITGQGNGQGGREHGQKADQLPGYRSILSAADRAHIAKVWGVNEAEIPGPGTSAYEMLDRAGSPEGIRALLVFASNPVVSAPNSAHIQTRLSGLDFLMVADFFLSDTAEMADLVLPVAQWAEMDGTMTNLEGRVIRRKRAVDPPEGVPDDVQLLSKIAASLGYGEKFPSNSEDVFDELRRASAGGKADYSGITYKRIESEEGVFWPCPSENHPGSPRLFLDSFAHPDGKAQFHAAHYRASAEVPDEQYPLYLTTGRVMAQYQSGTQTRRVPSLNALAPAAFVEMHAQQATLHGLADGEEVLVQTRRGESRLKVKVSHLIRPDTIFVPFHWAGSGRANLLTNPALDPVSRMPEFKVCAARIVKLMV